ncbi:hypothetical protein CXG81DRAFT_10165, partial [Caulochytrium protostelioides]
MDSATATATAAGVAGVAATLTASRTASSASASPSASSVVDPDTDAHVILRSFEWSLVFNVCGFCVLLLVFSLLARGKSQWLRTAYQPRTFLLPERQRSPVIRASWNPFVWIVTVMRVSDEVVLQRIGPDAFSVIYIMRWMSYYFCFTFLAALTALVPTNITGGQALFGLDALTITNVSNTHRYWIIVVFSYVGTLAFLACLHRLFQRALCLRHTFLLSQEQRDRLSGYSLLVRDVPKSIRTPEHLRDLFEVVQPDSIHGIVISDYLRNLPELWDRRCATRNRLERVATEILQSISRARWAELCREQNAALTGPRRRRRRRRWWRDRPRAIRQGARALRSRPKRSWYLRWRKRSFNSVFVVFNNLVSPHIAVMANLHHTPGIMQERYIGVDPRDIYWQNLRLNVMERRMRWVLFLLASGVVIVFWSVLSTAINSVAQIQNLDQISSALKPLTSMDDSITGLIQGLIPSLAMSILTAILPICLRYLLVLAGHPTWLSVERSLIQIYYAFLIINVLLVGVIAGSTLSNLESWGLNPANILDTLAKSAPPVSTFFINYVLFQTCIMGGLELIRPFDILTHLGSFFWRNPSPRVTRDGMRPPRFAAGQALAKHSLIATIGLVYADIAPLILLFVAVYFSVWVVIYRYNFMYVYSFPTQSGGNFLFTASRQMFTGLYLHQIVLSGYFLLKKSYAPAGFLLFLIFITAMVQIY